MFSCSNLRCKIKFWFLCQKLLRHILDFCYSKTKFSLLKDIFFSSPLCSDSDFHGSDSIFLRGLLSRSCSKPGLRKCGGHLGLIDGAAEDVQEMAVNVLWKHCSKTGAFAVVFRNQNFFTLLKQFFLYPFPLLNWSWTDFVRHKHFTCFCCLPSHGFVC